MNTMILANSFLVVDMKKIDSTGDSLFTALSYKGCTSDKVVVELYPKMKSSRDGYIRYYKINDKNKKYLDADLVHES